MPDRFFNGHLVWILNRLKRLGGAIPRRLVKGIFLALLLGCFAASDLVPTYAAPDGQSSGPPDSMNDYPGNIYVKEISVTAPYEKNSSSPLTICTHNTTELWAEVPITFFYERMMPGISAFAIAQDITATASSADVLSIATPSAKTSLDGYTLDSFAARFMVKGLKKGDADITFSTSLKNPFIIRGMQPPAMIKTSKPYEVTGTFHIKVEDCPIKVLMIDQVDSAFYTGVGYMDELTLQPGAVEGTYSASAPYTFNASLHLHGCPAFYAPAVSQTTFKAQVTDQGINLHWDFGPVNIAVTVGCIGAGVAGQRAIDKSHVVTEATFGPDGGTVVKPSSASPTDYYTIIVTRELP